MQRLAISGGICTISLAHHSTDFTQAARAHLNRTKSFQLGDARSGAQRLESRTGFMR